MKLITILLIYFCCLDMEGYSQIGLPTINFQQPILLSNGIILYPSISRPDQYYYLPNELQLKRNEEDVFQFSLMRYESKGRNGSLLSAQFTFEPITPSFSEIQKVLNWNYPKAIYMGAYPFYYADNYYGKAKNIICQIEILKNNKTKVIEEQAVALSNNGLIISMNLSETASNEVWQALNRNDESIINLTVKTWFKSTQRKSNLLVETDLLALKNECQKDGPNLSEKHFEQIIDNCLKPNTGCGIKIYSESNILDTAIIEKRAKLVLKELIILPMKPSNEETISFRSSKVVKRTVIRNGEAIINDTSLQVQSSNDYKIEPYLELKPDEQIPDGVGRYPMGDKIIERRPIKLSFNLTAFFRQNSSNFFRD